MDRHYLNIHVLLQIRDPNRRAWNALSLILGYVGFVTSGKYIALGHDQVDLAARGQRRRDGQCQVACSFTTFTTHSCHIQCILKRAGPDLVC